MKKQSIRFWFIVLCALHIALPRSVHASDTFGNGTVITPTTASGGAGAAVNLQVDDDTSYSVAKSGTMTVGGFGGHAGAINSVYLFAQYSVESGYNGTNGLKVNGVDTTIVPAERDYGRWGYIEITGGSFGIDSSAEIQNLSVTFTNNDGGAGDAVLFDCIYVVVNPTSPIPILPTWMEDFNGTGAADPMVWNYELGYQRNNELQYYVQGASNGWQENGNFVIEGRKESINGYAYTSASIVTSNKYYWHYGRAQIRAQIPAKAGMWPAIWGTGETGEWPYNGEVDIMEYYQNKILANCAVGSGQRWTAKWDSSNRTISSLTVVDPNWSTQWHIWTMQWDETNVRLYVDNILMNTIPQTWLKNTDGYNTSWGPQYPFIANGMSCWLNLAMGGAGGDPAATMNSGPQRYLIDYWKIWEGATDNVAPTDIALSNSSVQEGLPAGTKVGDLSALDADPAEVIRYSLVAGAGSDDNALFAIPEFVSDNTTAGILQTASVLNFNNGPTRSVRVRATDIEGATYEKILTITVNPDLRLLVSQSDIAVQEGGTATFDVRLSAPPASNVTVSVDRLSGDSDLSVSSGGLLVFTPVNGTNWQQVTVTAAEDADLTNGSAVIVCVDLGGAYSSVTVNAAEIENDNQQPVVSIVDPGPVYLTGGGPVTPVPGADIFLDAGLDDGSNAIWEDSTGLWNATIDPNVTFIPDAGSGLVGITSAYDFPGGLVSGGGCEGTSLQDMGVDTLPITLEIWFKPDESASYPSNGQVLWETGGATGLGIFYNNGYVEVAHDSNSGQISADVRDLRNEFIQVVVTYDPTTTTNNFKLYINGNHSKTINRNDPDMCASDPAGLGKRGGSNTGGAGTGTANTASFDGKIAIFRSYHNQILTPAEVTTNFNSIFGNPAQVVLDGNVVEPDGEAFTVAWTLVSGPGSVSFADPTAIDTTATMAVAGTYVLRLTADDGTSVPGFAEVTISVVATGNTPPSFTADPFSTADATVGVAYSATISGSATDADVGDTLSHAKVSGPAWLGIAANGDLSGTPSSGDVGANVFTVSVSDGNGGSDTATLNITVSGAGNNPPTFTADPIAGTAATEDAAYSGSIAGSATDADAGDTLTYAKASGPAWLGVAANGDLSGTPANDDVGLNAFTVSVNDGNGGSDTATLNITVININDAPVFTVDPITGPDGYADAAYSGTIASIASDDDGDSLAYAKVSGPAWLSVAADGTLSGTPASGDAGLNAFTVSVTDSIAAPVNAILNINVSVAGIEEVVSLAEVFAHNERDNFGGNPTDLIIGSGMNGYPDTGNPDWPTGEGLPSTWVATSNAYQAEHQSRDFLLAQTPSEDLDPYGVLLPDGVGPTNGKIGWYVIDIGQVTTGLKDLHIWHIREIATRIAADFNIYIAEVPTVPVPHGPTGTNARDYDFASGGWTQVATGVAGVFRDVTVTSLNGASARYIGLEIMANGGATDERVGFAEVGLTRISGISNNPPVWTADPIAGSDATEDAVYAGTLAASATDPDAGAILEYAKVSGPAWLSMAPDGTLSGTPTNADVGANAFTVSVTDNIIAIPVEATLNITVINTNDAPVFTADPINGSDASEDAAYSGTIAGSATDVDAGATLSYAIASGPAWLNVASDGTLSGTPSNDDVGSNVFTVNVSDGNGGSDTATLDIIVINTNDAPFWTSNPVNGANATEDAAYSATLSGLASDIDAGASLSFAKVSGPAWLSVAGNGALSGTPANGDVGANVFTVSVTDGIATPVEATLNITVENTNDPPVFTVDPIIADSATENVAYTGKTLAGAATDADTGDTITYSKVSGPSWLSVASDGTLSGTPDAGTAGLNQFVVRATDNNSATTDATLEITVVGLPLPWTGTDIGTGMLAGSAAYDTGIFTHSGSGTIGSTSDKLHYVYQTLSGDGEIIANISTLENTGNSSRVGVMIRDTLAANSKQIFMGMAGNNQYRWDRRTSSGGNTSSSKSSNGFTPDTWVRLVRGGSTITSYKSTDGSSWTIVGSVTNTSFASNCYIGLAVGSGSDTTLNTSQFSNVSVTP